MSVQLVLVVLSVWCFSLTHSQIVNQDIFGFSDESTCAQSGYLLVYSIPLSCNHALSSLLHAGLPLDIGNQSTHGGELGDLCQTYCITPMRQAGEDCQPLAQLHTAIQAACQLNSNGTRCFDTGGSLEPLWDNCTNITAPNCTQECTDSLEEAFLEMGCCLSALVTSTGYPYPFTLECAVHSEECEMRGGGPSAHYYTLYSALALAVLSLLALT